MQTQYASVRVDRAHAMPGGGVVDLATVRIRAVPGSGRHDQVGKGKRWMSWRREAMKDVGTCDMPWGAGNQAVIQGSPNGKTQPALRAIHI